MALFNYATKEITLKIVYYGPGLSGKTTNLQHLHTVLNPETKGKLLSLATEADRTLFFDFLPVELGKIRDFSIRFQLYTVPGQVRYNATRKVVLKGADAVVFVADSQQAMREQNIESYENMLDNLVSNNINPDDIPILLQFNKRDLRNILPLDALNQDLNQSGRHEGIEAAAINGTGVEDTFKKITKILLKDIAKKHKIEIQPSDARKTESPVETEKETRPEPVVMPEKEPEPPRVELSVPESETVSPETIFEPATFISDKGVLDIFPEDIEMMEAAEYREEAEEQTEAEAASELVFSLPEEAEEPESAPSDAVSVTAPEPVFEIPALPVTPSPEALVTELPDAAVTPSFPAEKFDSLEEDVADLSTRISRIVDVLSLLQRSTTEIREEIAGLRKDFSLLQERVDSREWEQKELKELRDLRREQKETADMLKDALELLGTMKEKKSWFRF